MRARRALPHAQYIERALRVGAQTIRGIAQRCSAAVGCTERIRRSIRRAQACAWPQACVRVLLWSYTCYGNVQIEHVWVGRSAARTRARACALYDERHSVRMGTHAAVAR